MKILFWGTPAYAVPSLEALVAAGHELVGVVSQPDRRRGRGKELVASPVKARALDLGLPVFTPERIRRDGDCQAQLAALGADLSVVVAFGQILPPAVLDQPPLGCWNGHGSLLPRWPAPAAPYCYAPPNWRARAWLAARPCCNNWEQWWGIGWAQTQATKPEAPQLRRSPPSRNGTWPKSARSGKPSASRVLGRGGLTSRHPLNQPSHPRPQPHSHGQDMGRQDKSPPDKWPHKKVQTQLKIPALPTTVSKRVGRLHLSRVALKDQPKKLTTMVHWHLGKQNISASQTSQIATINP